MSNPQKKLKSSDSTLMKLMIQTPIKKDFLKVFTRFDLELFQALKPPLSNLKVERFDGCKKGDEVHLLINGQKWISHITESHISSDEAYFVDVGFVTLKPIKTWTHIHRVKKTGLNECLIIDDIEYSTGNLFLDKLIYPVLFTVFSLRTPIYKRELS